MQRDKELTQKLIELCYTVFRLSTKEIKTLHKQYLSL